jgi:hypothetical protein
MSDGRAPEHAEVYRTVGLRAGFNSDSYRKCAQLITGSNNSRIRRGMYTLITSTTQPSIILEMRYC